MKKGRVELIVDIGSASVGACFATFKEGTKPVISHVTRVPLRVDSHDVVGGIQALALQALKKALESLPAVPRADRARIILAAPWYASEIKIVVSESDKPLKIGRATVTHALRAERTEDSKKVRTGRTLLESVVNQVYVNGYPTALHKTVQGSTLKVNLYESEADTDFVEGVTAALHNVFPRIHTDFHTFPFIAFAALRFLRPEENFTIVDIGGEITDIAIGDQGALRFMGSFPKGAASFVRDIAGTGSVADAASRLTLFARGELRADEMTAFSEIFAAKMSTWNEEYGRLVESALLVTPIPRTTFLFADKDALQWFGKAFSMRTDALPVLPVLVTSNFFEGDIALGEGGAHDPFLSLEVLFSGMADDPLLRM